MIDVVKAFADMAEYWNTNNACGWCWEFEAPLRESDLNESQPKSDECCTRVMATNYRITKSRRYNDHLSTSQESITHNITLRFLRQDDIGKNVYTEQAGHPLSESKWATILDPMRQCINFEDACLVLGIVLPITRENWSPVIDEYDGNYTGWKVDLVITENI